MAINHRDRDKIDKVVALPESEAMVDKLILKRGINDL